MSKSIDQYSNVIAAVLPRWKRNRDIIEGEDAVKLAGEQYLPRLGSGPTRQTDEEYRKYLKRTPFFPAASRTAEGLRGLIFRKDPIFEVPAGSEAVFETITHMGETVLDLAEEVVSETFITGYTGLLVDHPPMADGLTMANAIDKGFRPFVALYRAENIMVVEAGVVGNVQRIVRVVLWDDENTRRELLLVNGVYRVVMWRKSGSEWVPDAPVTPTRKGKPLDKIPFVLVTSKARAINPIKGVLDDVVRLNLQLYLEQADAKNSRYYSSAPVFHIKGAEAQDNLHIGPGTILQFPESSTEKPVHVGFAEFSGHGQDTLENAVSTIKDELSTVGSRILATEKNHAETADALSIRKASENATLAAITRMISRKIEEALNLVAWWMDTDAVKFILSTDFLPVPMNSEERKAVLAEWQAGFISTKTAHMLYQDGEILPMSFDSEADQELVSKDAMNMDRPSPLSSDPQNPQPPVV